MPTSASPTQISYEQFCESIADELKTECVDESGTFDASQFKPRLVQKLLADFVFTDGSDFGEEDFVWTGTGAQNGIDAFCFDVVAPQNDDDGGNDGGETGLVARVVRYLAPGDFPASGRAVLQQTAMIREFLNDPNSKAQSAPLWGPLLDFWTDGGAHNRLELFFASAHPLPPLETEVLESAQASLAAAAPNGASGALPIGVEAVSLQSLYGRDHVDKSVEVPLRLRVPDVESDGDLIIGAASLLDLYEFLREFKTRRGDLDPLYEKNVRVFLGRTGSINKGISKTLREEPQNFGLYNNGLTIVSRAISPQNGGLFLLTDPSVVNGCQTTRTLWDTLTERLREPPATDAQGREKWEQWRQRLETGRVVVKIVRVAPGEIAEDDGRLENITRYTNAQNAVKAKDFIALDRDFRRWKRELAMRGVFLEILRNEGAAQKAREKLRTYDGPRYGAIAKAFELFKVYGAGWMNEPGDAWNKNAAFVPGDAIFRKITEGHFSGDDLMAALHLQNAAQARKFGKRGLNIPESRRLTRFLFFRTSIELMRRLLRHFQLPFERGDCTRALLALQNSQNQWRVFCDEATDAIDEYLRPEGDYSVQQERAYGGDFNSFFKKSNLAKTQADFPNLWSVWNLTERVLLRDAAFMAHVEPILRAALQSPEYQS